MMKKQGFTLAEVLITLVIIGVIAAMTLPSLLGGTNKQEIKTGLQKAMSTLSQAVTLHYALTGEDFSTMFNSTVPESNFQAFLATRMNTKSVNGTSVTTQDGIRYTFGSTSTNCNVESPCQITVDVNGQKGPNQFNNTAGKLSDIKDQFPLWIYGTSVSASKAEYNATSSGVTYTDTVGSKLLDDCYTTVGDSCSSSSSSSSSSSTGG